MHHFYFVVLDWERFLHSFLPFELNIHLFHTNFSSCKMKHACITINVRRCILHVNFVFLFTVSVLFGVHKKPSVAKLDPFALL